MIDSHLLIKISLKYRINGLLQHFGDKEAWRKPSPHLGGCARALHINKKLPYEHVGTDSLGTMCIQQWNKTKPSSHLGTKHYKQWCPRTDKRHAKMLLLSDPQ